MDKEQLDSIVTLIKADIQKQDTVMRPSILAKARLAVTLRYLVTGNSMASLSLCYRMGRSTISGIIAQTYQAIWKNLQPIYMKPPEKDDFYAIARDFYEIWNFPHCIGAIDGKHCRIQCPANSGSDFNNFHEFHSIVLMAVADAHYKFIYVDVGAKGKENDSSIFARSGFGAALRNATLPIPDPSSLLNSENLFQFIFVGDEAFPLQKNLMRPYPRYSSLTTQQRIFNYRLTRARRVVENAFGIMSVKFRILRSSVNCKLDAMDHIVKATCVLRNFLITTNSSRYSLSIVVDREVDGNIIPGTWRNSSFLQPSENLSGNAASPNAIQVRNMFMEYFSCPGAVPWQNLSVQNGLF
ncbi:uncharacterized protein LOC136041670 [Artemia franciscana]|uniref:DDE Tnp4 domain-containing protein n=1 Tax=Artemia franciscana TaxID=6661 RepID=A0AA88KRU9_ARTSF|nr:hypothetical protein QYM36_017945 [Artemia franciscana]KAK2703649.1 hypothetical protein QYM36_017945 [Artemia franciscana]